MWVKVEVKFESIKFYELVDYWFMEIFLVFKFFFILLNIEGKIISRIFL